MCVYSNLPCVCSLEESTLWLNTLRLKQWPSNWGTPYEKKGKVQPLLCTSVKSIRLHHCSLQALPLLLCISQHLLLHFPVHKADLTQNTWIPLIWWERGKFRQRKKSWLLLLLATLCFQPAVIYYKCPLCWGESSLPFQMLEGALFSVLHKVIFTLPVTC